MRPSLYVLCHCHGSQGVREHSKGRGGAEKQGKPMRADQVDPFPTEAEGGQHYEGKKLQIG